MRVRHVVAVALLLAAGTANAMPTGCQGTSAHREPASVISTTSTGIAFIGASASDGFQLGDDVCLANTFGSRLLTGGYQSNNYADGNFFKLPEEDRGKLVDKAIASEPGVVVAADFLFWYVHCMSTGGKSREEYFEGGLSQLSRFMCPVLVGDIPDVKKAAEKTPLIRFVLPPPEFLQKANKRLREWVRERNLTRPTLIIPLADAVAAQMEESPLRIGDREYATTGLLQEDRLHPTYEGQVMLCRLVQQTLVDGRLFRRSDFK